MELQPTLATAAALASLLVARPASAKTVGVSDVASLNAAISAASAGDEIVLASGTYHFSASPVCSAAGTPSAPIVVRSATPLGAKIELDALEGFHVTGPNWHFEGLEVHGVCADDADCEHAFHVTGNATGFVLRDSRIVDFNAQLKVNADESGPGGSWAMPNGGLVEGNEIFDTHPRATSNPVTKLNIDTVDDWVVRANFIHDGHKGGGDQTSYQSFMKGGGKNGLYERNLVICTKDDTSGGTRIGLSFGGGGTGAQYCAPAFDAATPCDPEMTGGTMRNNIIVNCSDVGIYLNKAKDSHILYNTLIATNGVDFRFISTSGEADGNVLASILRTRDGGTFTKKTNLENVSAASFASFYLAPLNGDLRKKGDLSSLLGKGSVRADVPDDYCARGRGGAYDLGALEASLGDCDTTFPPPGPGSAGPDAGTGSDAAVPDASTNDAAGGHPDAALDGASVEGDASPATAESPTAADGDAAGGCGCSIPGAPSTGRSLRLALVLGIVVALRRRATHRR